MRLFISLIVPPELHRYCAQLQSRFPGLKNTHEFHLTLQFLGDDIPSEKPILDALSKIAFSPFEIEMGDILPFPNPFQPRGIWIACQESDKLKNLADRIRQAMSALGYLPDKPFRAHITLGRYKQPPVHPPEKIKGEPHRFKVEKFYLMESALTPAGPKYKRVGGFPTI